MLAMAFALSVVAIIAFFIVGSITHYNTKIVIDPPRLRGFKKDPLSATAVILFKRSRWINVNLASVSAQKGVDAKFEVQGSSVVKITLSSKYAGRFSGLTLRFDIVDVLNLFTKQIQVSSLDFTYESLPLSILRQIPRSRPMPLTLGEKSGKSPGSSLELYSLENYVPFTETKNVMWKKVARMPDEKLIVRVRDSSIPKVVTIGCVQVKQRRDQENLEWMDLVCEAVGTMGNSLLTAGCLVEILQSSSGFGVVTHEVSDLDQLSDAVMRLSETPDPGKEMENVFRIIDRSDIIVCGMRELEDRTVSPPISKRPALAIMEKRASPYVVGQQTMIYTGVEDVRKLISNVLEM